MIQTRGVLKSLPKIAKRFLIGFILVLSFGYGVGGYYIYQTSGLNSTGIEENYLGNENDELADEMKFRKSEKAILTLIHGHVISFGLIFGVMGLLMIFSSYSQALVSVLSLEPLISIFVTFGGIWLLWLGVGWMKYVIIFSGSLMHLSFITMVILLLLELTRKPKA